MAVNPTVSWLFGGFVLAFAISVGLTYRVRGWFIRLGVVDLPDGDRRRHSGPIPRAGGVAVLVSIATVLGLGVFLHGGALPAKPGSDRIFLALVIGGLAVFGVGLVDDIAGLTPRTKFMLEAVIATALYAAGVRMSLFGFAGHTVLTTVLELAVTILWIVGVTNAFNLIDGSDGVAAGAALFAATALALVLFLRGDELGAFIAVTLSGATLGFLFFNFPPASVFLGDSGSLLLGYSMAALGAFSMEKAPTMLAIAIPVVSCGLPLLDTLLAMVRRFLRGESMFTGDRGHIHHRLRDLGHSPRMVALLLYAACAGFALLSLLMLQPAGGAVAVGFVIAGAVVWVAIQRLRIPELLELARVVDRGFQQRAVIARNLRVREGALRLREARDGASIAAALEHALGDGEFRRAELILEPQAQAIFGRVDSARREGDRYVWSWPDVAPLPAGSMWEVRLPFRGSDGIVAGRVSLWHSAGEGHLLTDVSLIAAQLVPELEAALERLKGLAEVAIVPAGPIERSLAQPTASVGRTKEGLVRN